MRGEDPLSWILLTAPCSRAKLFQSSGGRSRATCPKQLSLKTQTWNKTSKDLRDVQLWRKFNGTWTFKSH